MVRISHEPSALPSYPEGLLGLPLEGHTMEGGTKVGAKTTQQC